MRAWKLAGAAAGAVIAILALVLFVGVPSTFLTSMIQQRVERDTGYRLTIAGTSRIGVWPTLHVTLNDVTLDDPKERDGASRLTVDSLEADMTLASAWSGHPDITEIVVRRPVIHLPLLRERLREPIAAAGPAAPAGEAHAVTIKHVTIADGTVVFSNPRDRVENRIDGIDAEATLGADRAVKLAGSARAGATALKFAIKAMMPPASIAHQNVPVELSLEVPGRLRSSLTARAEVRLNGQVVMINDITGTLDDGPFTGWASVDIASKPLVKVDVDFQRLALPASKPSEHAASEPWSSAPFDLTALNYLDAQVKMSAGEITIADARFASAAAEATLAGGILKVSVSNLGAYGGQASGEMIVDATTSNPTYAMHCDLVGVRALPLLTDVAAFDKVDGKLQAKMAGRSSGASQHAILSNLSGTAFVDVEDGAIRGLNVARMIRTLTSATLSGWQESKDESTDLSQLSGSFRIERGQASTNDLNLVGPLVRVTGGGTVDVGAKQLALRVDPKLVMTTQGQGRTSEPVGLGIPVVVDGPWDQPRIYPDMAGILDDPGAAYAKLKEMGKGLFGSGGGLDGLINGLSGLNGSGDQTGQPGSGTGSNTAPSDPLGGQLGSAIGNLIQQGIQQGLNGRPRTIPPPATPQTDSAAPPGPSDAPERQHGSQPMNDVLKQLFSR